VRRVQTEDRDLECVAVDLGSESGWTEAIARSDEVHHVASPALRTHPKDNANTFIAAARDDILRVLRAARDERVRRVVLTSSLAAIRYMPKPDAQYTEDDWTDPHLPGIGAYPRAITIVEHAAWDFMRSEGGSTELVVINPAFVLGPPLVPRLECPTRFIEAMLNGKMTTVPRQRFGISDVRDIADLHMRAMTNRNAAGKRYIAVGDGPAMKWLDIATVLRHTLGHLGPSLPIREEAKDDPRPLIIQNKRARNELGWRPRPVKPTILETATALRDLGLLESPATSSL
jgi:nucleoside-diphosphate-sugar epimerase